MKQSHGSKKDGGLGIGSLYGFNRALLFKWKWRFMSHPSALWVLIIKSLSGHHGGVLDSELRVKNGMETSFWDDHWISDDLLKDLYPRVYNLDQVELLSLLETHVNSIQRDRWIWTGDGDGIYSVKRGRKLIDKGTLCLDTYATRWLKEMPAKIADVVGGWYSSSLFGEEGFACGFWNNGLEYMEFQEPECFSRGEAEEGATF
ncbi:hypothetical protein Tco_0132381 [Tanacetum coccineum]